MDRRAFALSVVSAALTSLTGCRTGRERPRSLRVLTYNLHHGEGTDGRLDLDRIARVITGTNPDLVALQEIDRGAARTGHVDQPAEYQRLTGLQGWFGAAMPFQDGHYGQMLLSRWPLLDPEVIRLPGTAGREPRIAVTARVHVPGAGPVRMAGVHLDASRDDGDRFEQAGALLRAFGSAPTPTLLAGDFNAQPQSRVMQRLLGSGLDWCELSASGAPGSRIDYILGRPCAAWVVEEARFLPQGVASDHPPVWVQLRYVP